MIATDTGNLEAKDGGMLIPFTAEKRMGEAEELGFAFLLGCVWLWRVLDGKR